jgi:hypothetical protein
MRRILSACALLFALVLMPLHAVLAQPPLSSAPIAAALQTPPSMPELKLQALENCIATEGETHQQFTLFDPHHGLMYRWSEPRVSVYGDRRVQVVGALLPTPNIAAQQGYIDPTISATAMTRVNLAGITPFNRLKLHVERIRSVRPCGP